MYLAKQISKLYFGFNSQQKIHSFLIRYMSVSERLSPERSLESKDREQLPNSKSYSRPICPPRSARQRAAWLWETSWFYWWKTSWCQTWEIPKLESRVLLWSSDAPTLELVANFARRDSVTGQFEGKDYDPKSIRKNMSERFWKEH